MSWTKKRAAGLMGSAMTATAPSSLRYRIGIISDVHSGYTNSTAHFAATLQTLYDLGAREIVTCGDSAVNGTDSEWQGYIDVIEASPYTRAQLHECNGNHDGAAPDLTTFRQYSNNGALSGENPYFSIDLFGDRFIFLAFDQSTSPASGDCFSSTQLDWLEAELAEHYDKGYNVWIVEHSLFYGWGAGDIMSAPRYPRALSMSYAGHQRLQSILIAHPQIIMVHGHTHIRLEDRDTYGVTVYAPPETGGCHQLHVPAVSAGKYLGSSGEPAVDWSMPPECWLCDVYANKIVFTGIRADTGAEIPGMTYTIER